VTVTTATRPSAPRVEPQVRWAWQSGPSAALEHSFDLSVEDPALVAGLARLVAPFRSRDGGPGPLHHYEVRRTPGEQLPVMLSVDGERLCSGRTATDLSSRLTWHLNRSVIERSGPRYVLLHAAAATIAGVTVILPADMESGKTTTVAGLLRDGFGYVTDEAVALDPVTGWVTPFPKLLSLDQGSWPLFADCRPHPALPPGVQWYLAPQDLGAEAARAHVPPPRVVVFPRYVAGARTEVVPVSRAEALQGLAQMTFDFPDRAGRNLHALATVAASATAARLVIGSLDDAVSAVAGLVSQRILEEL
jgi:hypothetical protein